jgi:hypothetical protein
MLATNKNKNKHKNKNVSCDLPYASRAYQIADQKKGSKKKKRTAAVRRAWFET